MARRRSEASHDDHRWVRFRQERLLEVRMCDLGLTIGGTEVEPRIRRLYQELEACGLRYRPPAWVSDEWFAAKDAPGIAVPFYLTHPRLKRLERQMMLDVEGGTARSCMKLLRHEAGHAFQFVYGLHRRKRWRELFGRSTDPYPEAYRPKPYSRNYVLHLDNYYAQAHPDEDFAETFAVWMTPGRSWRKRYADWPALRKLEYVDELMREIGRRPPPKRSRRQERPLKSLKMTLREHYEERQSRYGLDQPDIYNRDLRLLFAEPRVSDDRPRAAPLLRRWRNDLLAIVGRCTGQYPYTINEVYDLMIERCRQMRLRVPEDRTEDELKRDAAVLLAVQTMNHLHRGGRWIAI
jgi:hypothetical protein